VKEEVAELEEVVNENTDKRKIEDEFGDVLFSLVNYARFIDIDPEAALERTNRKFKRRFEFIEKNATKPLIEMSLEEMDVLWDQAKLEE
jgi:XTP/dITP diphosphohydrolase